jgi:hypothetical protein
MDLSSYSWAGMAKAAAKQALSVELLRVVGRGSRWKDELADLSTRGLAPWL